MAGTPASTASTGRSTTAAVVLGVVALFAALTPVALGLDSRVDRTRPMYEDRSRMEWLQYQAVVSTEQALPVELAAGESVEIADERFTASAGVVVEVRADAPDRPCVRTSNQHGDVSAWACLDLEDPPTDPDLEDADLAVGQTA